MTLRNEPNLPVDQIHFYQTKAHEVLTHTLSEYTHHDINSHKNTKNSHSLYDKWKYKPLQKTRHGLHLYQERHPKHPDLNLYGNSESRASIDAKSPDLAGFPLDKPLNAMAMAAYTPEMAVASSSSSSSSTVVTRSSSIASMILVGQLDGPLNEIMYGLLATTTTDLQLRLRYMMDPDVVDMTMINTIETPSPTDPFQFLGLQRVVRGEKASRRTLNSRTLRDFVLVVASGIVQHQFPGQKDVQEVGYYLCQSVDVQERETHERTRGWLSTCSLFTVADNNSTQVDVFSRGYVDFKGKMQDYQATTMMNSIMLAGVVGASSCGRSKKLSWLLKNKGAAENFRRIQPETKSASSCCGICDRKFGVLHSASSCTLCHVKVCSRCRVSRDLHFVNQEDVSLRTTDYSMDGDHQGSGRVQSQAVLLCKNCKMNACHMDASVIACQEVKSGWDGVNRVTRIVSIDDTERPSRMSLSCLQVERDNSCVEGERKAQKYIKTPDTVTLLDIASLCESCDANFDVVTTQVECNRLDNRSAYCLDLVVYTKLESSFASTLSSPQDRDSGQEDFHTDCTPQTRHSLQTQYSFEDPAITYTCLHEKMDTNAGQQQHQANLIRRMQELQKNADSVYQFISHIGANSHC